MLCRVNGGQATDNKTYPPLALHNNSLHITVYSTLWWINCVAIKSIIFQLRGLK